MLIQITSKKSIEIDPEIIEYIKEHNQDFRVCTSCFGSEILPIWMKQPKPSDVTTKVGENTLYISRVQASYINRVDRSMLRPSYIAQMEEFFLKR
ncbi:MAG: hypothetical protein JSW00_19375 [Thermoplasmata archaeon]|nr:MAG: hypothetical protein JSW00_19375 [Thermoplasmata archaeon]